MKFKKCALFSLFILFTLSVFAKDKFQVHSPDGSISIAVLVQDQKLQYAVYRGSELIIDQSTMSWSVDKKELGGQVSQLKVFKKHKMKESYPLLGGHSVGKNHYNGVTFEVSSADATPFFLEVKAFNDGVAFSYRTEKTGTVVVQDFTNFKLPGNSQVWLQGNIVHYEGSYRAYDAEALVKGQLAGPPVVVRYAKGGTYAAITEAGLTDFAGMALEVSDKQTFKAKLDGETLKTGKIQTPWRVIMVGSLDALVNNDIVTNLSEKQDKKLFANASEWLKPGKSVWSWLTGTGVSFANMKNFSKLAGELGIEYNLVDEGWSAWQEGDRDGWALMKELVDYSREQNVKIWAWKAYPDRKGIPGLQTRERRIEFFKKCQEVGIVGLKIDFFDKETQDITRYFEETLEDAAKYGLMINFHGSNKPTGLNRTYPNEMTREGIKGYEYGMSIHENLTLPFTRLLAGHGDVTPLALKPNQMRGTTNAHQIASALVFSAPMLCLTAHPAEILASPNKDFIVNMPVVWDETIVLPASEIGEVVLLAKRSGKDWYIGGMTKEAQDLTIDLSFLGKGNYAYHGIHDDSADQTKSEVKENQFNGKSKVQVKMNKNGGFSAKLSRL